MTANASVLVNYEKRIIIGIYVDDNIYAAKELQLLDEFEAQLKEEFEVKLLGKARLILGMLVKRDMKRRTLHLSHMHYIRDLLSTYDMIGANPVGTPMIKGSTILHSKGEDAEFDVTDYQRLVGKLMHLSQTTQPDLAFVVSRLGQHMADLRLGHWRAVKRVLRYLKGTMTLGLEYSPDVEQHKAFYGGPGLVGNADSDYANDTESRQSTIGYVYCLNGAAVSLSSNRAKTVAVSSIEAEYVALSNASKQAIWMKKFINDLQAVDRIDILPMLGDNTSSIKMTKNDEFHRRAKYIDI